jgi:S-adenosylmethionine:tRNA ribosyltransferase-isomerase
VEKGLKRLFLASLNSKIAAVSRMKTDPEDIYMDEFAYDLPTHQIAEFPLEERHASRLLLYDNGKIEEGVFKNLARHLPSDAALFLNNTRVIEARIFFQKPTGGVIEIFCLEPFGSFGTTEEAMLATGETQWVCLIGGASKWKPGQVLHKEITVGPNKLILTASYVQKEKEAFLIKFSWPSEFHFAEVLHAAGAIPLPPYIKRKATDADTERYQTIFARHQGSVAAPTAALHFTNEVFEQLSTKGIHPHYLTLHVGAGTFKPVKSETIAGHQMHAEQFQVSTHTLRKLEEANNIVAVGTTSLRTLESLYWIGIKILNGLNNPREKFVLEQWEAYELANENISYSESITAILDFLQKEKMDALFCQTSLLIVPGYKFKSAQGLITNFHQPQSTLLLLVAAFIGDDWKKVYQYALENNFRFLSYGDSSLLWRKNHD